MSTQHPRKSPPEAKKHWGQHFLRDTAVCQQIVGLLNRDGASHPVLEVGPGRGALTAHLLSSLDRPLYLLEIDPAMVAYLHARYPALGKRLVGADFVGYPLDKLIEGEFSLIGNLPYNVASQILFHAITYRTQVVEIVCMLQKEVAQRIVSPPGSKRYGFLSVWIQAFYTPTYCLEVAAEAFDPPPNVTSAVIHLTRYRTSLPCDSDLFFRVVKTAFQQRRKMLRNALLPLGRALDTLSPELLTRRAEQLGGEDFIRLAQVLGKAHFVRH